MPTFDLTFRVSDVLQLIMWAALGVGFFINIRDKLNSQTHSLDMQNLKLDHYGDELRSLKSSMGNVSTVMTAMAVQKERLEGIESDVRDLKHGRGFIRSEHGIDREWSKTQS